MKTAVRLIVFALALLAIPAAARAQTAACFSASPKDLKAKVMSSFCAPSYGSAMAGSNAYLQSA